MPEADWLACDDPGPMMRFLAKKGSPRKFRRFTVACCRWVYHLLPYERQRRVEVAERHADGTASAEELEAASDVREVLCWLAGGPSELA